MSRRSFSNPEELISVIKRCQIKAAENSHRALIVIEMASEGWLRQFATNYSIPFLEASPATDRSDQITALLGAEQSMVIHQLSPTFDAGLFAALAGTIRAGGILILGTGQSTRNHFYTRFCRLIELLSERYTDAVVRAEYQPASNLPGQFQIVPIAQDSELVDLPLPNSAVATESGIEEQDQMHRLACDFLTRHAHACILLTGRRGRGKSMLLARLANWLDEGQLEYSLTSANQAGLSTIYQHCPSASGAFVSVDGAIPGKTKRLLVDEAGNLPLATLQRYLNIYEQLVLCTTVEGYEIGGRAFQIRFAPQVRASGTNLLELTPLEPWRWARTDPLEQLLDQLLLTDQAGLTRDLENLTETAITQCASGKQASAESRPASQKPLPANSISTPRLIKQIDLAHDERKLHSLFTLLRNTHYQTSAQDLQHLLDSKDIHIWVIENGPEIIATALVTREGQIDAKLHEAIVSKQRRLPHQLLPQLLAQSANTATALSLLYARVIRISVDRAMRRNGFATQLIACIENELSSHHPESAAIGASFAADSASIAFWQANGYTEFHRGFRQNPRTGKNAVAVIKAWGTSAIGIADIATEILADNNRVRERMSNPAGNRPGYTPSTDRHDAALAPKPHDHSLLTRFAARQRSLNDTLGPLDRLARRHDLPFPDNNSGNRRQYEKSMREITSRLLTTWP